MPNSVLWVFLIVVWLFVLVPMVLRGRPAARTSTKAAAQTRVVHRGGSRSAASRRAAAASRSSRAESAAKRLAERRAAQEATKDTEDAVEPDEVEVELDEVEIIEIDEVEIDAEDLDVTDDVEFDEPVDEAEDAEVVEAELVEEPADEKTLRADAESPLEVTDVIDIVDVEVVDLDEAQAARIEAEAEAAELDDESDEFEDESDEEFELTADGDDVAGSFDVLDDDVEPGPAPKPTPREMRGTGGYGRGRAAENDEAAYRERRRVLGGLTVLTIAAVVSAFFIQPLGYVAVGAMVVVSAAYLVFLRRAVRAEHARYAQRMARQRRRDEQEARVEREQAEPLYVAPPARLRRPGGAIVLEIDDEDPAFDHLPTYDFTGSYAQGSEFDDTDFDVATHRTAV
ncbi:divisome protein SepX/GlpR [Gordonia humi]|uniref:Transmembrane protein n=1 Tax=Gordonia humi TaxID=686429 RepID=A0A840F597_9ACTN|nr:gephyrin-like molybdotransferase receptor GlpR [Gordonia humi]MBB4137703.1 hypothetical protein [Gordonia humi]